MVRFVRDRAANIPPLADAKQHLLRRQRPLRHPAQPLDPDQPGTLDLSHHQSELVHMSDQHHRRRASRPVHRRN
jgi:hypothetical protein